MAMISSLLWSSREPGHGSKVGTAKTTNQVQDQVKAAKAKVAKVATESIALNAPMMRMTLAGETAGSKVKMAIMVTKKVAMKVAMK